MGALPGLRRQNTAAAAAKNGAAKFAPILPQVQTGKPY